MPRRPRWDLPDGFFHVTALGVAGSLIVVDDHDRNAFRRAVLSLERRFRVTNHAWCLMNTHFHIVLEAKQPELSRAMHWLNGVYAQRFNLRHGRRGHLFENRFSAWVIESEKHLANAIEYVLQNPVKAGLCRSWWEWPWSGARGVRRPRGRAPPRQARL